MVEDFHTNRRPVLDPRVAYVITNMMQNVIEHGTGFTVRQRGFLAPAAGKTGTSHDAWFAGYTSNLLCIVWVGYDDYSDLKLAGAATAGPIWAEFMKRAVHLPQYSNTTDFTPPSGVVTVSLDKTTNLLCHSQLPGRLQLGLHRGLRAAGDLRPRRPAQCLPEDSRHPASGATAGQPAWACGSAQPAAPDRCGRGATPARTRPTSLRQKSARDSGAKSPVSLAESNKRPEPRTQTETIPTQDSSRYIPECSSIYSATPGALPSSRVCAARRSRSSRWRWRKCAWARLPQARTK